MKFIYPAIFSKDTDGVFHGYFPDLEDCLSTGETLDEAIENANEAACNWLSVELEEDGHLPPVSDPADLELLPQISVYSMDMMNDKKGQTTT